jgi:hypothetical protein
MRAYEFLIEDPQLKSQVIRSLNKMPDENPIFQDVYKKIVGTPLANRVDAYINNRQDQDAIKAMKWLVSAIPTVGNSKEVKEFLSKFKDPEFDFIKTKALIPSSGMTAPASIEALVTDPFAKKLFDKIFQEYSGKGDAGPGEAALAILSPNITYSSPGDISVHGVKVEVKASKASGRAGRIWDMPVNQKPMIQLLADHGNQTGKFSVLDGTTNQSFQDPAIASQFINVACQSWFGGSVPKIEKTFGTSAFKDAWQSHMFDVYKEHGNWTGMLALGVTTYQYIVSGEEFAKNMKKSFQGYICNAAEKQSRALAPQVFVK